MTHEIGLFGRAFSILYGGRIAVCYADDEPIFEIEVLISLELQTLR